ncbi:MAG: hypothetical protein F4W89_01285 [Acidobacteria bacterium]|nr:hypothetical protein [Acidobacteriota bacterium]
MRRALEQIAGGITDPEGGRAWSLIGPYGSGKSAFAVFLADLLSPGDSPEQTAACRLLSETSGLEAPRQTLHRAVLTAERAPLDTLLLRTLASTLDRIWEHRPGAKPRVFQTVKSYLNGSSPSISQCATSDVVRCFEEAVDHIADKTGSGLLLIVDEAGKALEYAAQQPARGDIYLLQALAESAARSNGLPFVILTVLHQSFDQYAHQLDSAERIEWEKVQGRFGELAFRETGDQIVRLTSAAIRHVGRRPAAPAWKRLVAATAGSVSDATGWKKSHLSQYLDGCWPLHPVTTTLLGPLFRSRLAQNERSLFAFLSSAEPLGFQHFLKTHKAGNLYAVDQLYDYAAGILGSRLLNRDGRQWAEIDAVIRRLPAESSAIDERVLKTIGLLGMLGDQVGLRASEETLAACIGDAAATKQSLERLQKQSLIVFRQYRDAYQVWEGSDLDLDSLMVSAATQLPSDFSAAAVLRRQAQHRPLVARRHLFGTGTFRYFDVHFADASSLLRQEPVELSGNGDGVVLLTVPRTQREASEVLKQQQTALFAMSRYEGRRPVVVVAPRAPGRLMQLARELAAAELVQASTPALASDKAARHELAGRLDEIERQLAEEVDRVFDPAQSDWCFAGDRFTIASRRDASRALSDLCDVCYSDAPPIMNELLNRNALSSSAARARRVLLEAMIQRGDVEELGFEGSPPEVSMYRSVLLEHGFHRKRQGVWGFGEPGESAGALWKAVDEYFDSAQSGRLPLEELYERLRRPPFGLKEGPIPVIVLAALLGSEDTVAVYEGGSFVPRWTPSHAERLLRSPNGFEVRQSQMNEARREIVTRLGAVLALNKDQPSLIDIVRALVRFVGTLTPYARRTQRLSPMACAVRETLLRAREPAGLLFEDLPVACGYEPLGESGEQDVSNVDGFASALRSSLRELQNSYHDLLARTRGRLVQQLSLPTNQAEMATELRLRAKQIRSMAVEPALKSFVIRAGDDSLDAQDVQVSLLAHLTGKPPGEWVDVDEDLFEVNLAQVARRFRDTEALAVGSFGNGGDVSLIRLAVTQRGQAEQERVLPLRTSNEQRIVELRDRILKTASENETPTGKSSNDEVLTALALAADKIMGRDVQPE